MVTSDFRGRIWTAKPYSPTAHRRDSCAALRDFIEDLVALLLGHFVHSSAPDFFLGLADITSEISGGTPAAAGNGLSLQRRERSLGHCSVRGGGD